MPHLLLVSAVLTGIVSYAQGHTPSAGDCGPTSVAHVPGCWGLNACASIDAEAFNSAAACNYNYCDCNDIYVPLLPETMDGTTTLGCMSYTIQPSINNCPTKAQVITTAQASTPMTSCAVSSSTGNASARINSGLFNNQSSTQLSAPPSGATMDCTECSVSSLCANTSVSASSVGTPARSRGHSGTVTLPSGSASSTKGETTITTQGSSSAVGSVVLSSSASNTNILTESHGESVTLASTTPASTAPASTAPAFTAPASTAPASTAPASTTLASSDATVPTSTTLAITSKSSITGVTTVRTDSSIITIGTSLSSDSAANTETLIEPNGSSTVLVLPSGSSITELETVSRNGSLITVRPAPKLTSSPSGQATAILIDGSTIPVPSSDEILTETDGSTVVIGPSGVVVGSNTIPYPSFPTTITTDGATIAFGGEVSLTTDPHVLTTTSIKAGSATLATGTPVITPPPPGSTDAIPDIFPARGKKESRVAITLLGQTFILPHTISVELLQSDGSFVTLFSSSVVSGTATVSIPPFSSHTSLSSGSGDLAFEAGPEPKHSPDTGGKTGFAALIAALEGLASTANSIVDTLDQIGEAGASWAAGGSISEFSGAVGGLLDSATSDLSNFASTMTSTLEIYDSEVYEITDDGLRRIFPARTGAVEEFDLLESLRELVRGITGLRNDVVLKVKDYWIQGTAAAAAFAAAEEGLRNFGSFDWGTVKPQQRSSTTTATNSTATMSEPSASSSSSTNTSTPVDYLLITKNGTDVATFRSYIKTLPDKGEGVQMVFPLLPYQSYLTKLTSAQAEQVRRQPFIAYIGINHELDSSGYGAIPQQIQKRMDTNENLRERRNSDEHLRVISVQNQQSITGELPNYIFDPVLGLGQTIYIIDSGFNTAHAEFDNLGGIRTVTNYVVPNHITLSREPNQAMWAPEDITDYDGHGTAVASVAGGVTHGVASNANLVFVKFRNAAKNANNPTSDRWVMRKTNEAAVQCAWSWVIDDVLQKRSNGNNGKFVVNMSYGFEYKSADQQSHGDSMSFIMDQLLTSCWSNDIITVVAAGNAGHDAGEGSELVDRTPQNLGTPNNGLITVGGVDKSGVLALRTTFDAGNGGSLTVYAVSENVAVASNEDNTSSGSQSGTSFAAPAVAGLAAYFASLPSLDDQWGLGSVATSMKSYIVNHAYQRSPHPFPPNMPATYPRPQSVRVAYNRAPDRLCAVNSPRKRASHLVVKERGIAKRHNSSQDFDVVVSGTIVVPSLAQLYCAATSATLASASSVTSHAVTSNSAVSSSSKLPVVVTAPAPAPTVNTDEGILTCGTRTDQGNAKYWFKLLDMRTAQENFCFNLTESQTPIVFKPGTNNSFSGLSINALDNQQQPIRVSAEYVSPPGSNCPTFDFSYIHNETDFHAFATLCQNRLRLIINDCDTKSNGLELWKQGGMFYRDCITWKIDTRRGGLFPGA